MTGMFLFAKEGMLFFSDNDMMMATLKSEEAANDE